MSEVVTVGHGSASGVPDLFLLHAGLSTSEASAAGALASMTALDEQARGVLDSLGIAAHDRSTVAYAVEAVHDHRTGDPRGYTATVGIRLSFRDPSAVAGVTTRLAEEVGDALRIQGVTMAFSDPSPLMAEARAAAVRAAREQAEQIAGAADHRIGRLVSLVEGTGRDGYGAVTLAASAGEAYAPQVQPGESVVHVAVTGTWELEGGTA